MNSIHAISNHGGISGRKQSESTIENYRRLDVYPTVERIDRSTHQSSPEKQSPRHLRKLISQSEEKIRASKLFIRKSDTSSVPRKNNEGLSKGATNSLINEQVTSSKLQTLEILSRTPVRALRPAAGDTPSPRKKEETPTKNWESFYRTPEKSFLFPMEKENSAVRSRSSTVSCSDSSYSGCELPWLIRISCVKAILLPVISSMYTSCSPAHRLRWQIVVKSNLQFWFKFVWGNLSYILHEITLTDKTASLPCVLTESHIFSICDRRYTRSFFFDIFQFHWLHWIFHALTELLSFVSRIQHITHSAYTVHRNFSECKTDVIKLSSLREQMLIKRNRIKW